VMVGLGLDEMLKTEVAVVPRPYIACPGVHFDGRYRYRHH